MGETTTTTTWVAARGKQTREGQRGKGQVIMIEWDVGIQVVSEEKANAEA
jgi:hypothetical protein